MTENIEALMTRLLKDMVLFCQDASLLKLRKYQIEVARQVIDSVLYNLGHTIVVVFPRQSGKNELQAQIETYLMTLFSQFQVEIVKVSPTWKPQTLNAMRRLERVLMRNLMTRDIFARESGYIFKIGGSRIYFLSGSPTANVVGATANLLLECDEAQDITTSKWDKDFAPMAASTNATRVFWGTAWTSKTLLAREMQAAAAAEKKDGYKRVFRIDADEVRKEVKEYGKFVDEQIMKLGRDHPIIKTQYFCQEIDAEGGMFTPERLARIRGSHACQENPVPGEFYAVLLDVAGEEESQQDTQAIVVAAGDRQSARDATALTVVQVDLASLSDELIKAPTYRVVHRALWTGKKHSSLYGEIKAIIEQWQARYVVIDSTGVGQGLASFLEKAFPNAVIPYHFTSKSKSDLGWGFLAVIETGRFKDHAPAKGKAGGVQQLFLQQCESCQMNILEGPTKAMRWGVPDGFRDPATGQLVHDDLLISAALCVALDGQEWGKGDSQVINSEDVMQAMVEVF